MLSGANKSIKIINKKQGINTIDAIVHVINEHGRVLYTIFICGCTVSGSISCFKAWLYVGGWTYAGGGVDGTVIVVCVCILNMFVISSLQYTSFSSFRNKKNPGVIYESG